MGQKMLEIRDLVKVYKTKGGAEVRALDNVSVRFEEKGMVFLLGKSGSGKSTFLNLCGGLDSPDSGEIIIKGRSSKDFSQSDFDSYRNTFVGFVFQEYNILEEFTVEENIAIALELQGKNKNKEQVNAILEQVDLANFAKRKPNTLSGGQKQRVAIARALVKNPEIIMADEPTGALDSNTGKQVFDTLKKLSAEKLVIVVSHDREFAEIYGDRIIELKDGKIISDLSKTKNRAESVDKNMRFWDNETISIKSGAKLTTDDLERINRFLIGTSEDVIITTCRQDIADFRKSAHIDEECTHETFETTDETCIASKTYSPEESKFIRSKLPLRHALRIGSSSLKVKPVRLIFTILLSFIAFTMFGLFSTMTFFSKAESSLRTYIDQGYEAIYLQNHYNATTISFLNGKEDSRWINENTANFTQDDLDSLRSIYTDGVLGVLNVGIATPYNVKTITVSEKALYQTWITEFATIEKPAMHWQDLLLTDTDLGSLGENDIVISSYTFRSLQNNKLSETIGSQVEIPLESYDDIVGKTLIFRIGLDRTNIPLTVRGVYRNDLPEKYSELDGISVLTPKLEALREQLATELSFGSYRTALVSEEFGDAHFTELGGINNVENSNYQFMTLGNTLTLDTEGHSTFPSYIQEINSLPSQFGDIPSQIFRFDGKQKHIPLTDNEIIVPYNTISVEIRNMIDSEHSKLLEQAKNSEDDLVESLIQQAAAWEAQMIEYDNLLNKGNIFLPGASQADYDAALQAISQLIKKYEDDEALSLIESFHASFESSSPQYTFSICGFYYGGNSYISHGYFVSENNYKELMEKSFQNISTDTHSSITISDYKIPENAIYRRLIVPIPDSVSLFRSLLQGEDKINNDTHTFYSVDSMISKQIDSVQSSIDMLEQIFLWVGIVMALFSMLLLFNFISVSIANKNKEIGILRAVGARSTDIFKIFYSESILISAICYVLAIIACFVLCSIINQEIAAAIGVSLFIFGPLSWLVMLAIAIFTSLIATFLPVHSFTKRKPVESIRAL